MKETMMTQQEKEELLYKFANFLIITQKTYVVGDDFDVVAEFLEQEHLPEKEWKPLMKP